MLVIQHDQYRFTVCWSMLRVLLVLNKHACSVQIDQEQLARASVQSTAVQAAIDSPKFYTIVRSV